MAMHLLKNVKISYVCLAILVQILFQISFTRGMVWKKVKIGRRNIINATEKQIGTVYFLHPACYLGEHMMDEVLEVMPNFSFPHLKVVFPTAPREPYDAFDGHENNIWFNRISLGLQDPEEIKSIQRSLRAFKKIVDSEVESGIPIDKIIIGGFSQGGGFALHVGYRLLRDVAGIYAMSSFLPFNSSVYRELAGYEDRIPPLFMTHGEADTDIPFHWGHLTYQTLTDLKVKASFYHEQNSIHEVTEVQIQKLHDWILSIIPIPNVISTAAYKDLYIESKDSSLNSEPDSSNYDDSAAVRKRASTIIQHVTRDW